MKKLSKIFMLVAVAVVGAILLASCGYKGKKYVFEKVSVSEAVQAKIDSINAIAGLLGQQITVESLTQDIVNVFKRGFQFSKDGKELTWLADPDQADAESITLKVISEGKYIYVDDDGDGVLSENEKATGFEVRGSKLVIRYNIGASLGVSGDEYWAELVFKRA
ncbi:MAG: hypothetical protein LBV55_03005 [Acholeplasmatales bacterium]|jgi:hypothetical protein|nr:hypothetical protein [Acholeplasmatales bacterium]